MTKIWTLQEAQQHLPELMKQTDNELQMITENGIRYALIKLGQEKETSVATQPSSISTWQALRSNFDYSNMGDEVLFERIKDDDRDIEW